MGIRDARITGSSDTVARYWFLSGIELPEDRESAVLLCSMSGGSSGRTFLPTVGNSKTSSEEVPLALFVWFRLCEMKNATSTIIKTAQPTAIPMIAAIPKELEDLADLLVSDPELLADELVEGPGANVGEVVTGAVVVVGTGEEVVGVGAVVVGDIGVVVRGAVVVGAVVSGVEVSGAKGSTVEVSGVSGVNVSGVKVSGVKVPGVRVSGVGVSGD
ncbi:hypothetical protein PHYPSEUDO_008800 [Phytophthora pseudosyringae]|uniref:Uncharacterized protein n=1 Tax=Phytophthora pseudosyringae TaxID=221518 RepID=A0A8T1W984_9STRA|nr:hypothetical protein PHYPSEUDO_008800 [Phytophthora pseudosyringae]